jgi:hypothetical protein
MLHYLLLLPATAIATASTQTRQSFIHPIEKCFIASNEEALSDSILGSEFFPRVSQQNGKISAQSEPLSAFVCSDYAHNYRLSSRR